MVRRAPLSLLLLLMFLLLLMTPAIASEQPFVNFEVHPQRALDLSPDRRTLAVAHTADQRVQLFDVSTDEPIALGHVVVGVDPVAVKFRSNSELWVVNHISDSVSVVDLPSRQVRATLATADEPFDVIFAGERAFVSCSQANQVLVFDVNALEQPAIVVPIQAEDPRALALSPDGSKLYVAIFESGNNTTVLGGGLSGNIVALPNVVSDPRGPYAGVNPPPNRGNAFDPPLHPAAPPPRVGLIVRKDDEGRWMDDNHGDWTNFVSGPLASASGRRVGWNLVDRDIAVVDTQSLAVSYITGLMNIGMALAVKPGNGEVTLVGTEALNEIRFEPKLNGVFLRVQLARVAGDGSKSVVDLNPHLDYQQRTLPPEQRRRSIGDPRALVWRQDGQRGWVAGLGSNNVIAIDGQGARVGDPIAVGQGPAGLALDEARQRLYVWNHFEATLSVIDTAAAQERSRTAVFNPLPSAIVAGRPLLYDTHLTSGLGHVSCASCHVDARMDRLGWDLGDPSLPPAVFDQNCITVVGSPRCEDYHAMKGPMATQTLQDIIGHEPLHWRGDRRSIEAFNPAFKDLLANDRELDASEMAAFKHMLATIHFPPNPFRGLDNSLPRNLELNGHYTSGRFSMAGIPLGTGDAQRGLQIYTSGLLDGVLQCASCHTLPTGMAVNGPLFLGVLAVPVGGSVMPLGPMGENHLGIVSTDGSTNVSIKVPHLRNQYDKVGFELTQTDNLAGFGFLHDGSVDSLSRFLSARVFSVRSDRDIADLTALMLAFSGSEFGPVNPILGAPAPLSRDSHAAVGQQLTLTSPNVPARAGLLLEQVRRGAVDLVVHSADLGYSYEHATERFLVSDDSAPLTVAQLQAQASSARPLTMTLVPRGLGKRLGIDRDGDGVGDHAEIRQGSNPADANSRTLRASAGLWYNPARSGHGIDLHYVGDTQFLTWYTYADDGSPTWYQAVAPTAHPWTAPLARYVWNPQSGGVVGSEVGEITLQFSDAAHGRMDWRLGSRTGSEPIESLLVGTAPAAPDHNGTWYHAGEPGWGLSVYSAGSSRIAILYFYDGNQQPRWVLGSGDNSPQELLAMDSYSGFCPDCAAVVPTTSPGGSLQFAFSAARTGSVRTDAWWSGQPGARWLRGPVPITPLSDPVRYPARQ